MKINKNNYEVYFIDYYDGNLTAAQKQALELFLSENPDLKEEFEAFEMVSVEPGGLTYPEKTHLKKQEIVETAGINEDNYEKHFIAFYENDLESAKQKKLMLFLEANPHLNKEFKLHAALFAEPALTAYHGKSGLKKKAIVGFAGYAAAAMLLVLLALSFLLWQSRKPVMHKKTEIAQLNPRSYTGSVTGQISAEVILVKRKVTEVSLPEPETTEQKRISLMAAAQINNIAAEPDGEILYGWGLHQNLQPVDETKKPKQRSLLAQVLRKNIEKVKDEFGIERIRNYKSEKSKQEPGFVRFLNGSLTVFNTLTGSETELVKSYDKDGNLKDYRLEGRAITVTRKMQPGGSAE